MKVNQALATSQFAAVQLGIAVAPLPAEIHERHA
jgi:hypothetical protein